MGGNLEQSQKLCEEKHSERTKAQQDCSYQGEALNVPTAF